MANDMFYKKGPEWPRVRAVELNTPEPMNPRILEPFYLDSRR
jgi:hypothetical protein